VAPPGPAPALAPGTLAVAPPSPAPAPGAVDGAGAGAITEVVGVIDVVAGVETVVDVVVDSSLALSELQPAVNPPTSTAPVMATATGRRRTT
jgi:hypothetical protein